MKTIYEILTEKNPEGKWYNAYTVAVNFPAPNSYVQIAPPENLINPKWNWTTNQWEECQEDLIELLKNENKKLIDKVNLLDKTLFEVLMLLPALEDDIIKEGN